LDDALELTITRTDAEGNDLLTGLGETAVYNFLYEFDSGLEVDPEEDDVFSVTGSWELVLTLDDSCGHTWNNALDLCTNV
jgi:hypothetical protein